MNKHIEYTEPKQNINKNDELTEDIDPKVNKDVKNINKKDELLLEMDENQLLLG